MPPVSRRGQRTEEALLAGAQRVFAEQGYFNAKIADITKAAGRSPGAFYTYYENKAQLLDALLERFSLEVTEAALASRSEDPRDRIRGSVAAYWSRFREHKGVIIGLFQLSMTEPAYARRWQAIRATGIAGIAREVDAAKRAGLPDGQDSAVMASALLSMMESFAMTWLAGIGDAGVEPPDDEAAVDVLAAIWHGALYGPTA